MGSGSQSQIYNGSTHSTTSKKKADPGLNNATLQLIFKKMQCEKGRTPFTSAISSLLKKVVAHLNISSASFFVLEESLVSMLGYFQGRSNHSEKPMAGIKRAVEIHEMSRIQIKPKDLQDFTSRIVSVEIEEIKGKREPYFKNSFCYVPISMNWEGWPDKFVAVLMLYYGKKGSPNIVLDQQALSTHLRNSFISEVKLHLE